MIANQPEVKFSPKPPEWSQLPEPIRQRVVAQLVKLLARQVRGLSAPQQSRPVREVGDE
jgi:hypothetical protein